MSVRWISEHEKQSIESTAKLDAVCKLTKTILGKVDPKNATTIIDQIEEQERSLKESMSKMRLQQNLALEQKNK
jgi:hypothetical protein